MTVREILSAKTAGDLLSVRKEAGSMKMTDPKVWSTPLGMLAGLALTYAMSKPANRTRGAYLMGGALGAAGGVGVGDAIKTNADYYADLRKTEEGKA